MHAMGLTTCQIGHMADIGTGLGQVGQYWQLANFFWHGAKSHRTTWGALKDSLRMLAGWQCDWQGGIVYCVV